MMRFHVLHHLCKDLRRFGSVIMLDGSAYEHFNVVLKRAYGKKSMRRENRMRNTSCALRAIVRGLQGKEKHGILKN